MLRLVLCVLLCHAFVTETALAQSDWFPVDRPSDGLVVALDTLPDDIAPQTLARLYDYLRAQVMPHPDSELRAWRDAPAPVLVRVVSAQVRGAFPLSTESYGGMTGWAQWECLPPSGLCRLLGPSDTPGEGIVVALVADTGRRAETLGLVTHELSHVFGTVDGPRCPYHADYHPGQTLPADPSDAYWWYGVTGVFTLVPVGVTWDALNDHCAGCEAPDICAELSAILAEDTPGA